MSTFNEYLDQKRVVLKARDDKFERGQLDPVPLKAVVTAEGRSGVRRIRIREHQILNDSPHDFAGYDLGASSPETMVGALGGCVVHSVQVQAAMRNIPIDSLTVEVTGLFDARAGRVGYEHVPYHPSDIAYTINIDTPATDAAVAELLQAVESTCPLLSLIRNPQTIRATVNRIKAD